MKQGKTEKAVFAKLSTDKVELGLQQDLEAKLKSLVPMFNDFKQVAEERQDAGIKYSRLQDQEKKLAATLRSDAKVLRRAVEDYKQKAKELGVDADVAFIEKNLVGLEKGISSTMAF